MADRSAGQSKCLCHSDPHPPNFLCNPILAFLAHAFLKYRDNHIHAKEIVVKMCSPEAITAAKTALWAGRSDTIGKMTSRRNSVSRTRQEKEVDDIEDALNAVGWFDGIPDIHLSLDDAEFFYELMHQLHVAHREVSDVSCMTTQIQDPPEVPSPCCAPTVQMEEISHALSQLSKNVEDLVEANVQLNKRMSSMEKPTSPKSYSDATKEGCTSRLPQQTPASVLASVPAPIPPAATRKASGDEFKEPKRRRKRRGIAGCAAQPEDSESSSFCAPDKDIFIYQVSKETVSDDVKSYIERLNKKRQMRVIIKDLRCVSHPESVNKSFRLTVSSADYVSLMRRDVWPPDVRVRRFIRPKTAP